MEIALVVLQYLLPVILGVLALLATVGVKKLLDKWGVERSERVDAMIDDYVKKGIGFAESWANHFMAENGAKASGTDKRAKAIGVVLGELKQSGITDVAEDLIVARIESMLVEKGDKPGIPSDPTPGESA
jgi:hypothetical protein